VTGCPTNCSLRKRKLCDHHWDLIPPRTWSHLPFELSTLITFVCKVFQACRGRDDNGILQLTWFNKQVIPMIEMFPCVCFTTVKGWVCQHRHYRNDTSVGSNWRQTGLKKHNLAILITCLQTAKKRNWRNREDNQCKSVPHPMFGRYYLMVSGSHKCQPSKPVRERFANSNI
jgi:hypothetical protein